jgi:microcompartment protein CcmK/EutM
MRLGTVIGRITLTQKEPVYTGGRLLIVQPWTRNEFATLGSNVGGPLTPRSARQNVRLPKGSSVVVFDELGAGQGNTIGFTEGAEAAQPFNGDAPVDAYCVCILDQLTYVGGVTPPRENAPTTG